MSMPKKRVFEQILLSVSLICFLLILLLRLQYSIVKIFDPDEMTHLHTTYLMSIGKLPFLDFYWGHLPYINFLLFPIFKILPEGPSVLIASRLLMFLINCGSLFILYKISRKLHLSPFASILALIYLLISPFSFERFFEIRPDIPMVFFILLSVYLVLKVINTESKKEEKDIFLIGLSLGIANAFLLRGVFAVAVIGITFLIYFLVKKYSFKKILKRLILYSFGLILPILSVISYWYVSGILNLAIKHIFYYGPQVFGVYKLGYGPWVYLGIFYGNYSYFESSLFNWFYNFDKYWFYLTQITWTMAVIVCIKKCVSAIPLPINKMGSSQKLTHGFIVACTIIYAFSLYSYRIYLPQYWMVVLLFVSLLAAEGLYSIKKILPSLPGFIFGLSVVIFPTIIFFNHSFNQLGHYAQDRQLKNIQYIIDNSKKTDAFYDGIGAYVFRPDCAYSSMAVPFEIPKEALKYIIDEIKISHCTGIILGLYERINMWGSGDVAYMRNNYASQENPEVWFPKIAISLTPNTLTSFTIIKEGYYSISNKNIEIDGKKIGNDVIYLGNGIHKAFSESDKIDLKVQYNLEKNKEE